MLFAAGDYRAARAAFLAVAATAVLVPDSAPAPLDVVAANAGIDWIGYVVNPAIAIAMLAFGAAVKQLAAHYRGRPIDAIAAGVSAATVWMGTALASAHATRAKTRTPTDRLLQFISALYALCIVPCENGPWARYGRFGGSCEWSKTPSSRNGCGD